MSIRAAPMAVCGRGPAVADVRSEPELPRPPVDPPTPPLGRVLLLVRRPPPALLPGL